MIYDCCVRQKKCRSILKHVLKRCDNRKSCRRPLVSLSHATKSYRVNRTLVTCFGFLIYPKSLKIFCIVPESKLIVIT